MMTKEEFVSQTVMGGLTSEARKALLMCFDEDGNMKTESFPELCLMHLQSQTSARIQMLNKAVADAIREFVFMRQWTNLSEIYRTLPEDIERALKNEDGTISQDVKEWCVRVKRFNGLSADDQRKALAYLDEQEWKVRNRSDG